MDKAELIEIARAALTKLRLDALGVASYGCVDADGSSYSALNEVCHAACSGFVSRNEGVILYTITTGLNVPSNPVPDDIKLRYFEWLCSAESPWADCLNNGLNTDARFVSEYGLLITDLDKHGKNLVIASLAASRACFEHPSHINMWDKLVQDGVEPRWAFFVAGFVTFSGQDTVVYGMRSGVNHWPLHPWSASEKYIKNYLTQTVKFDEIPFSATGHGTSVGGAWGPLGEITNNKWGSSCYGTSTYWDDLKKKVKSKFKQDPGDFVSIEQGDYKSFLEVIKQEQERLYA